MDMYQKRKMRAENKKVNNQESFSSVEINYEEWANAKLPKNVEQWTLYKFGIFRDLIKMWRIKLFERRINPKFQSYRIWDLLKCIYIDKDKNVKIDFKWKN